MPRRNHNKTKRQKPKVKVFPFKLPGASAVEQRVYFDNGGLVTPWIVKVLEGLKCQKQ